MKLLVDVGNQRLKWATIDTDHKLDGRSGTLELDDSNRPLVLATQLDPIGRPESVWVSCVAKPEIRKVLDNFAHSEWSLKPFFISSPKRQAGIVNAYADPASLGSDRWAALVAVGDLFPRQPVIVVDAGTAITVDLLDDSGRFQGGVIFPGIQTMQSALIHHTENINFSRAIDLADQVNAIATNTRSAVVNGALMATAGGINLAIAKQQAHLQAGLDSAEPESNEHESDCRVVMAGGDARRLEPLLAARVTIRPDLVLWGLSVISRESAQ